MNQSFLRLSKFLKLKTPLMNKLLISLYSVEFISYYLDRATRVKEMKSKLDHLLNENSGLTAEEAELREK